MSLNIAFARPSILTVAAGATALVAIAMLLVSGCVRAPNVAVVDRKTALEEQAAGEFRALENELIQAALAPKGEDFTRAQLEEAGVAPLREFDRVVAVWGVLCSDKEVLDDLQARGCLGEGLDGLLVETPDLCRGDSDKAVADALVQRTNRSRRQLWRYIDEQRPELGAPQVREAWRATHLRSVACGTPIEIAAGRFERKPCDD